MMDAILVKNLTKKYKDRLAVDNISFNIHEGEIFGLLGLNGAGKTTTIKILCSLSEKTNGEVYIFGKNLDENEEYAKKIINVSPQETAIAPKLTVLENLIFMAEIYGIAKAEAKIKANELLKTFDLADRANSKVKSLSGGMQRKLSIAMALISEPKIIFLDEPTLGLDVYARRELWKILKDLKKKVTIILTTHYLEEAEALADRIAILDKGKVKAIGTAEELKKINNDTNFEDAFLKLTEMREVL